MTRLIALACMPSIAMAAPTTLGFDGRLVDALGAPLEGAHIVDITLHTDSQADSSVWTEQHGITASDGYFHVDLGRINQTLPTVLAANGELFVEVAVGNSALGPRTALNAAPYSLTDQDTLGDLACSPGDSVRWNGNGWACDPQPQFTTFRCESNPWSKGANTTLCSTTVTLEVDSLVVASTDGHWTTGSTSQWCIVEIQYPGEGSYYSGVSSYAEQLGSAHGYPGGTWQAFSVTRAKVLPGGQTHTLSVYASESSGGTCTVNGSSLHGWVIPM